MAAVNGHIGRPDIVVGIDIGQTCSGVAYSIGPDWSDPRTINRWPSLDGTERADKVATRVGYSKVTGQLSTWGFESTLSDTSVDVKEQFKLTLDAEYEDDRGYTCQDARKWYYDYLVALHREIEKFFDASIPRWRTMRVEYSFSTPTTWKNPAMIASIEKLMGSARFVSGGHQTVRMALTEAEAAAIEASTTQYRQGDIFLICEAGGGTTDVNVLKVKSVDRRVILDPLDHVEGIPIGSTLIDFRMAQHIVRRLELIREHLDGDIFTLADEMLTGRFQTVKHSFPNPVVDQFWLDFQGLAGTHSFPEAGITNSRMAIDRATLMEIFDQQLRQIFTLMDQRLQVLEAEFPNEQVSYIILSGGLGSSPYLYEQIQLRYERNYGFRSNNTASMRVMRVLEPQLAVVRGLVRERTQQLGIATTSGQEVFQTRRCRNSYGVVVREKYDSIKHAGLPVVKEKKGNQQWVEHVVDWFIIRGKEITPAEIQQGISRKYASTIKEQDLNKYRSAQIVMSTLPVRQLPRVATDSGCKRVALVKFKLTESDMTYEKPPRWKFKKRFWRADFAFIVKLGPADVRFQIVGKNGVVSSNHDNLEVEFEDPSERRASRMDNVGGLPIA